MENMVTADAIIPDKRGSWYNLNRRLAEEAIPEAWVFRLEKMSEKPRIEFSKEAD